MVRIGFATAFIISFWLLPSLSFAADVAYIHGRVASNGTILEEGEGQPFDPMLLSDTGRKGLSQFKALVESQGHSIMGFRDKDTLLTQAFLEQYDVVIFGLHQKIWSVSEKQALQAWLNGGGGMFIYSDSASGGSFQIVGAQNPVGQNVTNNLIADYDMEVTVDQADGVRTENAIPSTTIPSISAKELQGEGVSLVAVAKGSSTVEILVPYTSDVNKRQGLTIDNPDFAALALRPVGDGHVMVMFDRQPMWNDGPGSDINQRDNRVILRDAINFLAARPSVDPEEPLDPRPNETPVVVPTLELLLDD